MKQAMGRLVVHTSGQGLYDITSRIAEWVAAQDISDGLLTVFIRHTSASLVIQENADPDVLRDLQSFFDRVVPEEAGLYRHRMEGPDDMPAHIRAALTATQVSVPVLERSLGLGTWQGLYVFEHRTAQHTRTLLLHLMGT